MYLAFVVNSWNDGLMQEETISTLYQRTQNGWSKRRKSKELRKTVGFHELIEATKMSPRFAGKTDAAKLFHKQNLQAIPKFLNTDKNICKYTGCPGGECAGLRENVPYIKVHRSNPKHPCPKLNGYGDNGERKVWSSCGSMYCTRLACCYPYTAHVRPSVSQSSQAHSALIINRCHSYSEL